MENAPLLCLNCNQAVIQKYCANCGQKTTTHRYSFRHFVEHDLIHGIWHVDNGVLFTLKSLFTKPGRSVREYVSGKRAGFFNFFTLLLIILGVGHFLTSYSTVKMVDLATKESRAAVGTIEAFFEKYPKASLLMTIPIYSIFSFVLFKKARFNLTEHFVLNSYKAVAESVFAVLFTVITIFYTNLAVLGAINSVLSIIAVLYAVLFYYQFFSQAGYSKKSLILRSFAVPVTYMIFYIILGILWKATSHA